MWLFGRAIKKFWHNRTAYLGHWLYLYLVILEHRLWHCGSCIGRACHSPCSGQRWAGTRPRETASRPSHVRCERPFTCPQVLTIVRMLPHLEKDNVGNCPSYLKFIKWKTLIWFLKTYYFVCALYKCYVTDVCSHSHVKPWEGVPRSWKGKGAVWIIDRISL